MRSPITMTRLGLLSCCLLSACGGDDTAAGPFGVAGVDAAVGSGGAAGADAAAGSGGSAGTDARAGTGGSDASVVVDASRIPAGGGWHALPGTKLSDLTCPFAESDPGHMTEGCAAIVHDWAGGIADTKRNRLVFTGGGHSGYGGNELYALDVIAGTLARMNDPTPMTSADFCLLKVPAGCTGSACKPSSKHTYDGLAYLESRDEMSVFGGGYACPAGSCSRDAWSFDLAAMSWRSLDPLWDQLYGSACNYVTHYDPNTGHVFIHDTQQLWEYDAAGAGGAGSLTQQKGGTLAGIHHTGVVDPGRKLFIAVGDGEIYQQDVAAGGTWKSETVKPASCQGLMDANAPGLAYDPIDQVIVGWPSLNPTTPTDSSDTVYVYDPAAKTCTTERYTAGSPAGSEAGPRASAHGGSPGTTNGTFGRFRYFPVCDCFALVSDYDVDAYVLRRRSIGAEM